MNSKRCLLHTVVSELVILSLILSSVLTALPARRSAAAPPSREVQPPPADKVGRRDAQATHSLDPSGTTDNSFVYLPLVTRGYDPLLVKVPISTENGGVLQAPDGTVIRVLPGAFTQDGYLLYKPLAPTSAPPGMQATPRGFELRAFADTGEELRQFTNPIVGRIPYDYADFEGASEDSLGVYYLDAQVWQPLPSQVDHLQVVFTTTHFSTFGLMAEPLALLSECDDAQVGREGTIPVPAQVKTSMCNAFLRAGGIADMGVAESGPLGDVHEWGSALVQDFTGGTLWAPILIYRDDTGVSHYMDRNFVNAYYDAGGPDGFLGLPESDPYDDGQSWHMDDNNDFRDGPFMYYQYGFIAYDQVDSTEEAHRNFPEIEKATWETFWVDSGDTDTHGNTLYQFTVRGTVNEAQANPNGKSGDDPELYAGFWVRTKDGAFDDGYLALEVEESGELTFPELFTETQPYQFYFFVWRSAPDNLSGYYPCNHGYADPAKDGWFNIWMSTGSYVYELDCEGGGGGGGDGDYIPPVIDVVEVWKNSQGALSVQARITDNSGVIDAYDMWVDADSNGQIDQALAPFPGSNYGIDVYAGTIVNIPSADLVYFTIMAQDPSGNKAYAHVNGNGRVWYSHRMEGKYAGDCGNPVNSSLGDKTEIAQDLVVPGRSGTPIVIQRTYHSQTDHAGPFGKGWSFTYDYLLEEINNPLLDGVHIRYPDGHTANYQHDGNGRYNSISPGSHEYVLQNGSGYALHTPDQTVYHFDREGHLTRIVNAKGGNVTLSYDGGHLDTITNESNRTVTFGFTGERITSVTIGPKTLTYHYQGEYLTKFVDADDGEWIYDYDANGFLSLLKTPEGHTKNTQTYNERGEVQSQTVGDSRTLDFQFDRENRQMMVSDVWGNTTTHTHDDQYRLIQATSALSYTETFEYDDDDNLVRYVNQTGDVWLYDYDTNGNRVYRADPVDGTSYSGVDETRWLYDENNRVISMTDSLGYTTLYEYDGQGNLIHAHYPDGGVITNTYYADGQLQSRTDPNGHTTSYVYNNAGDLWKVIDPLGYMTMYEYDELGRKTAEIIGIPPGGMPADGSRTEYRYNGRDQLVERIDHYGNSTRYDYDGDGRLTDEWDRNDAHTQYEYSECCSLLTKIIDAEGGVTEYGYNEMNLRIWMRDPNGSVTDYVYDEDYNLVEEIGPAPTPGAERPRTYYEYDARGNKIREIDPLGNVTRYIYDANNRLQKLIDAEGHVTEYCYDTEDQLIVTFDPLRAETRTVYDSMGRRVNTIDALGNVFAYTYDPAGQLVASVVPHAAEVGEIYTTTYEYNAAGRRAATIDPLGNATRYAYNGLGNTVAITDANGNVTRREYDKNNRLVAVTDAFSGTTRYGYDAEGRRVVMTDTLGHVTRYGYDLLGRTTVITGPLGQITRYGYDPNGNLITVTNALSHTTVYGYDALDRRIWERDPLGFITSYEYDLVGNRTAVTDAEGNTTRYAYDGLGRLISVTDALSGTTLYDYDAVGNRTVITYANGTTSLFQYNFLNQLKLEVDALGRTWRYFYDDAGHLIRKVDGEWQATYYEYDGAGRLTATKFGAGSPDEPIRFEYDAVGNPIAMHDGNGTLTREFDALNRPITVTDYLSRTLVYAWNPDGTRASLTYPDGRVLTYTYDAGRHLDTLTLPGGQTASYSYDPLGRLTQTAYSNGAQADYAYDDASRLTSLHNNGPGGAIIAWYDYKMDKVGNRVQTTERRPFAPGDPVATVERQYIYDDLYRLTRSTSSISQTHALNWELDSMGNWERRYGTPEMGEPVTTTYAHNPINALVQAGDWLYQYDRNGSRIAAQAPLMATQYAPLTPTFGLSATLLISYEYNYENRLVAVREAIRYPAAAMSGTLRVSTTWEISPTMAARYVYDGLGRRVEKWVTTTVSASAILTTPAVLHRSYVYDGPDAVFEYEEWDGVLNNTTYFYWGRGSIVVLERVSITGTTELRWYHYDGLNSVVALSDESGNLVTIYHYDEYGQLLTSDTGWNRYTYTGQEWDMERSLYHFYARSYSPYDGVWLSQDIYRGLAEAPLSLCRYCYVKGNPINFVDLLGFKPVSVLSEEELEDLHIQSDLAYGQFYQDTNAFDTTISVEYYRYKKIFDGEGIAWHLDIWMHNDIKNSLAENFAFVGEVLENRVWKRSYYRRGEKHVWVEVPFYEYEGTIVEELETRPWVPNIKLEFRGTGVCQAYHNGPGGHYVLESEQGKLLMFTYKLVFDTYYGSNSFSTLGTAYALDSPDNWVPVIRFYIEGRKK